MKLLQDFQDSAEKIIKNPGVQGITGAGILEGTAHLTSQYTGINSAVGTVAGPIKLLVEKILESANNPIINTGADIVGGLGTMKLSNDILNDLGIEKKWIKYLINTGIGTSTAVMAGSAAIPYVAVGSLFYWASKKHGWKYTGKALSYLGQGVGRIGKGVGRIGKGVGNIVTETANSTINLATAPFRGLYNGIIKNEFLTPSPVKAISKSVSN